VINFGVRKFKLKFQKQEQGPLLEKRFIVTPAIHFLYGLINVADTKNELLFFVSVDFVFFCIG
jgi:hypothetical protein